MLIYNDKHYLAEFVFGKLKNEHIDVKSIAAKPREFINLSLVNRLYNALIKRRLLPYFSIIFSLLNRNFSSGNDEYDELLVVGIEDLSDFAPVYKKYGKVKKLYFWQWNPEPSDRFKNIDFAIRIKLLKMCGFKIATFDKNDSIKHNVSYHPQIYSKEIIKDLEVEKKSVLNKALFIGKNKGRAHKLNELALMLQNVGVEPDFRVVQDRIPVIADDFPQIDLISEPVNYQSYLKLLNDKNIIVELNQHGQVGLTLRSLESVFFNKKLITDNKDIRSYDFYKSSNVLVLDINENFETTNTKLAKFVEAPYELISENVRNNYDVTSLIEHFRAL
ncbi:hypothetical protein [Erwinia sp. JH02]|uniref:hypothetical protein n=1 Tax=Erwinia sp. JH02 TaxID=2733394 RepID=UPI001487B405|nr:hypothetical protein [Erwinia sp. JH02]NNS07614.1 hypothetical protein [Erwinia sp. JH02]